MSQYVIDKKDFLKGIAISDEFGGFFRNMQAINLYSQSNIGLLMNASGQTTIYSESSGTALTTPVTHIIRGTEATTAYALSNAHVVQIIPNNNNGETTIALAFSGDNAADKKGAAMYKLGSTSSTNIGLFYSLDTTIGVYETTETFSNEGNWDPDFIGSNTGPDHPTNGTSAISSLTFRAMYHHKGHDVLYWNGGAKGNQVDKYDANIGGYGTVTQNALDLPQEWEIRDFGQLRNYLAVLATTPRRDSNSPYVQIKSKIFFWDGVSDSWQYETPTIGDQLIRLIDTEDGLFAVGIGDGVSHYQISLEQAAKLSNWPGPGSGVIDITAGRRDGNDLANYGAVDSLGNQIFFLGKDGNNAHVFSFGNRFNTSPKYVFHKPFYLKSVTNTGVINLGGLVAVTPNKIYASIHDTNGASADQYRIIRCSPALPNAKDARADSVELDAYFDGTGRLKKLNQIRFDVEPLASGDVLEVYRDIDYSGSWTRLDGGGSVAATNAIRFADLQTETTVGFTLGHVFRHMKLRFDWKAGAVKIRRIVVDFDYAE